MKRISIPLTLILLLSADVASAQRPAGKRTLFDQAGGSSSGTLQPRGAGDGHRVKGPKKPRNRTTGTYKMRPQGNHPTLLYFVADDSSSMEGKLPNSGDLTKAEATDNIINGTVSDLSVATRRNGTTKPWFHFGGNRFSTYDNDSPHIQALFRKGKLLGGKFVETEDGLLVPQDVEEYAMAHAEYLKGQGLPTDAAYERLSDGRILIKLTKSRPKGRTPLAAALEKAYEDLERHVKAHPNSLPPSVFIVTDYEHNVGDDPEDIANEIKGLKTNDGSVLLWVAHLTEGGHPVILPADEAEMPTESGRAAFRIASELPPSMLRGKDLNVRDGARAIVGNAGLVDLRRLIELGTQPHTSAAGGR